ncbi:hypothetical protein TWF281_010093 [Arthrobotrys megalospora]
MSSSNPSSGHSSSGSKSTTTSKPVYKFVTFEDTTPLPTQKQRNTGEVVKSWRDNQRTEVWFDKAMVDREMKVWGISEDKGYIRSLMEMGKRRREILDKYLRTLNETDKSEGMMGMWEPVCLYPGDPVTDKKTGVKIRPPELFWVIIKREKRVPEQKSSSGSGGSSSAPKGVLKDEKKVSSGSRESDLAHLAQELRSVVTHINTQANLPDVQAQLQQVMFGLSKLLQNQNQPAPLPLPAPYPHPQMQGLLPFQEPPNYSRISLPSTLPPQYHQYPPSPEDSQLQRMNPHVQPDVFDTRYPNNPLRDGSNRPRQGFEDVNRPRQGFEEDENFRNSHLNSIEPQNYPRGGAGSRRHSISSLHSHPMNVPDEVMIQMKYDAGRGGNNGGNMFNPDMQTRSSHMIANHPHNHHHHHSSRFDSQTRNMEMVESWQHDNSSSSAASDDEYRIGRPDSRSDMYTPGHLRNSRPRSSNRSGGDVDLSNGNRSRRGSVSFSDRNGPMPGHGRMIGMGKGYGSGDSGSEDSMPVHDQRMMMHHGMSIDRSDTRTPAPWPRHN